jgi:O-acetyl-ADP-ribose deacetylase
VPDHHASFLDGRVVAVAGDITRVPVDAIVNAANRTLRGGGGVDGAIHAAGGPEILRACEELRRTRYPDGLPTGHAAITTAGRLPARWVIHTVGPVMGMNGDQDAELLASCYRESLSLAIANRVESISFPAISTGVYGYPKDQAAEVASSTIQEFLSREPSLLLVKLVFFSPDDLKLFLQHHRFTK